MKHTTRTIKASELVEDFDLYPRNSVFDGHVYDLAEQIRGGAVLPPVVADAKTKRITDGFHRRRAHVRVGGPDVEIEVMLIDFTSDAEMVCDSIARNAQHGRRLTTADIARCAVLAKKHRITREHMAGLLNMTRERLKEITATRFAIGKEGPVLLRRPQAHLAGTKLTKAQEAVAPHVGGQTAVYHANRLIELIESRSLPPDDEKLIERLRVLHQVLDGVLVA